MWCCYNAVNFLTDIPQKTPQSSPVRVRYGVSLVDPASDWYFASVSAIINEISYNIGSRYNCTRLYVGCMNIDLSFDMKCNLAPRFSLNWDLFSISFHACYISSYISQELCTCIVHTFSCLVLFWYWWVLITSFRVTTLALVPVKQLRNMWVDNSHESNSKLICYSGFTCASYLLEKSWALTS